MAICPLLKKKCIGDKCAWYADKKCITLQLFYLLEDTKAEIEMLNPKNKEINDIVNGGN